MIFRLIRRWLWNRRRNIFRYNDGHNVRSIDPIQVAIGLHEHDTFLPRHLSEAADGNPTAQQIVGQAACDVFGVSSLAADGSRGLTLAERIELMFAFDAYMFALKKNIDRTPIKPVSTGSTSPDSSEPTMSDSSASGPTANDKQSAEPTSSEVESTPVSAT